MSEPRIIVALDCDHAETALDFCKKLSPQLCRLKIGKELFTAAGPAIIEKLTHQGFDIFLDLNFHDIPTTVAKACKAACELGVWMINGIEAPPGDDTAADTQRGERPGGALTDRGRLQAGWPVLTAKQGRHAMGDSIGTDENSHRIIIDGGQCRGKRDRIGRRRNLQQWEYQRPAPGTPDCFSAKDAA